MEPIPELNLPGLSPTAAKAFASARFSSDGGPIPDGTPREIYMYSRRDLRDEYSEQVFRKRVFHYFEGKGFIECIPFLIWLLNDWSDEFGTFCLDRVNTFIPNMCHKGFREVVFKAPQDVARCLSFLWDFIVFHSWTPMQYNWAKPVSPTVIKLSKRKSGADTGTTVDASAVFSSKIYRSARLWCHIHVDHLMRRFTAYYNPCDPNSYRHYRCSTKPLEYYDQPLHPIPQPDRRSIPWTEREESYVLRDMREAAKKISAREFVHLDVPTLLKRTDLNSLVDRYLYMLDKGEFKFLERAKGTFGGFV
ncbi:unnamed protein product [Tuber aestivum]|uniref:Uncharacterized protein n=1 Tax=Tuber aestivum TaxID=59557 RepID=A0A292Q455_9PEZI|nr:unnamed protein product [Tuber aestivum]